jgi:hypothetical protein
MKLNGFQYQKAFKGLSVGYRLIIKHLKCRKVTFCGKKAFKSAFKKPTSMSRGFLNN